MLRDYLGSAVTAGDGTFAIYFLASAFQKAPMRETFVATFFARLPFSFSIAACIVFSCTSENVKTWLRY